jgi:hypothetical protein
MIFDYEARVQKSLREMVRNVLKDVSVKGLTAPHHFYLSFQTTYPGVELPDFVLRAHPEEITIVLENEFWDLKVDTSGFSVMLTFQNTPHKIYVPFNSLLSFMDPSVRFGLHFTPPEPHTGEDLNNENSEKTEDKTSESKNSTPQEETTSQVISLDRFRKNNDKT